MSGTPQQQQRKKAHNDQAPSSPLTAMNLAYGNSVPKVQVPPSLLDDDISLPTTVTGGAFDGESSGTNTPASLKQPTYSLDSDDEVHHMLAMPTAAAPNSAQNNTTNLAPKGEGSHSANSSGSNLRSSPSVELSSESFLTTAQSHSSEDEDPDLRAAKVMAMAIAKNPGMSAAEIKELSASLVANATPRTSSSKKKPSPATVLKKPFTMAAKTVKRGGNKLVKGAVKAASHGHGRSSGDGSQRPSQVFKNRTITESEEFLSSRSRSRSSSSDIFQMSGDDELDGSMRNYPVRMTGIIWKRRSGLGKYSSSAAWERRRVVLRGSKLFYYRTGVDIQDDANQSGDDDGSSEFVTDSGGLMEQYSGKSASAWLESTVKGAYHTAAGAAAGAAAGISSVARSSAVAVGVGSAIGLSSGGDSGARGYLDLVKESASVGASMGHTLAPTPFALSIKVMGQTKWKLCFDTQAEMMQWLAAMTDVIVQGSVDSYNSQILYAHDPSSGYEGTYQGQLSEPPLIASYCDDSTLAGGHRLWTTGKYKVQSEGYSQGLDNISESDLEDTCSNSSDDEDIVDPLKANDEETNRTLKPAEAADLLLQVDPNSGKDVYSVPVENIWQFSALLNLGFILARASTTTVECFWYLLVFINVGFIVGLSKEKVGGTVKPKDLAGVSRKMVRRLSSHMVEMAAGERRMSMGNPAVINASSAPLSPVSQPMVSAVKPKAGTTTMRIEHMTDLPVRNGHVFCAWRRQNPAIMDIRSHGYKQTKAKVPSPGDLYECAQADVFESRSRIADLASRVQLPKVSFKNDDGPKTWNAPDIFVISVAIPTDPPKLYSSKEDGGGFEIVMYYTMRQETRDILKRVTADGYNPKSEKVDDPQKSMVNAVRLFDEWCRRAPTDNAFAARFKVVPNAHNLKEIGLPAWISKYNGKPFLIKRPGQTGFIYKHPELSCMEFDISLHPFPYLAKQGILFMKDIYFKKILVTFGFLIEGRSDDELPECLIGLMQLCYPDPVHALQGEDFLAGKAPKSFE